MRRSSFLVVVAVTALAAACEETSDEELRPGRRGADASPGSTSISEGQIDGGNGCMRDVDAGGQPAGPTRTIGERVPVIITFTVDVNRSDGFASPVRSDVWLVDVAAATVRLNGGPPAAASAQQVQSLVRALAASGYRSRQRCCDYQFVDGYPNSPVITVFDGSTDHRFGVGDNPCWTTANAFEGEVIGCTDFGVVFGQLETLASSGAPFLCRSYL